MIEFKPDPGDNVVRVVVSDRLHKEDFKEFVPKTEALIAEHGKLRVLFEMTDFHGWDLGALWEDIKFDAKHFSDIRRVAFLGDKKWEKGVSIFCKPFTTAAIRYFDRSEAEKAIQWLREA